MAPLPKKKHTRSRSGKRRAQKGLKLANYVTCPQCKKFKLPHVVCPHCGYHHNEGR
ncbi:MAG: 50S ribosomal protein L32 [Patescibacteria group bacterium]